MIYNPFINILRFKRFKFRIIFPILLWHHIYFLLASSPLSSGKYRCYPLTFSNCAASANFFLLASNPFIKSSYASMNF